MTTSNREWLRRQVEAEDGGFVSVGGFVMAIEQLSAEHATVKPLRQAFARLVQLKRRESALSIEQFAERTDIDLREIVGIETWERGLQAILIELVGGIARGRLLLPEQRRTAC